MQSQLLSNDEEEKKTHTKNYKCEILSNTKKNKKQSTKNIYQFKLPIYLEKDTYKEL